MMVLVNINLVSAVVAASEEEKPGNTTFEVEPGPVGEHLMSFIKEHPDWLMEEAFYPRPVMCGTSALMTLGGAGDKHGDALKLSYLHESDPDEKEPIKGWQESMSNKLNEAFSEQKKRVDVDDRLVVAQVRTRINKDGSVSKVRILNFCPDEFQDLIVNTLRSVKFEPPPTDEASVEIYGRFVQNYGPKIIDNFRRNIRSVYIIPPVKEVPEWKRPLR